MLLNTYLKFNIGRKLLLHLIIIKKLKIFFYKKSIKLH